MGSFESVLDFKSMTAMRANHIHTFSLVSELMTAVSASGRSARHSKCRMLDKFLAPHSMAFGDMAVSLSFEAATCLSNLFLGFIA